MRLLLLGGPRFLGRAIADAALAAGHELTFFNRGQTSPELYPEAEKLHGDRGGDLQILAGREWDAVIDTSGYFPDVVRSSAQALARSDRYCFVSSISAYGDFSVPVNEDSPLASLGEHPSDEVTNESYGPLKALCEKAVCVEFGDRALVVRPGLIVGPYDPTGRFTYWPHRFARGGEVLAPAPPERHTQFLDVRDLAAWIVDLCERGIGGIFNATHPGLTWLELLETCLTIAAPDSTITWVPDEFLLEHDVGEWMELPLWIADPAMAGADQVDVRRALGEGLRFRPLADTVRGALGAASTTDAAGLSPEREAELLAAWHA